MKCTVHVFYSMVLVNHAVQGNQSPPPILLELVKLQSYYDIFINYLFTSPPYYVSSQVLPGDTLNQIFVNMQFAPLPSSPRPFL